MCVCVCSELFHAYIHKNKAIVWLLACMSQEQSTSSPIAICHFCSFLSFKKIFTFVFNFLVSIFQMKLNCFSSTS